jgi:hypothetical protein
VLSGIAVQSRRTQNIHVLPNPCVFTINGVNIGVSSVDILSQIGAQQYSRHIKTLPESLDGVQLLALQLLEQRRYVASAEGRLHFITHALVQFLSVIPCARQRSCERQPRCHSFAPTALGRCARPFDRPKSTEIRTPSASTHYYLFKSFSHYWLD